MIASGINPEGGLVEIVEIKDHPWFVGVQFHPEYQKHRGQPASIVCELCGKPPLRLGN